MNFKKLNPGIYQATRKDGVVITIETTDYPGDMKWRSSQDDDFDGDNTGFYATKREAIAQENYEEDFV
jgi:hypothetical protein